MKDDCDIASDEWFIPVGWQRGETVNLLKEKDGAVEESKELLSSVEKLKGEIEKTEYDKLLVKFKNLAFVAELWRELAYAIFNYVKYFETREKKYHAALRENLKTIDDVNDAGIESLGTDFYNYKGAQGFLSLNKETDSDFTRSLYGTFLAETESFIKAENESLTDFVICGSAMESHRLQKEVNFSDTFLYDGETCRIAGNKSGLKWSSINAHGWFSYQLNIKKNAENVIVFTFGSATDTLCVQLTVGDEVYAIKEKIAGKKDYEIIYRDNGQGKVRVRVDRVDENTPLLFTIKVKG